MVFQVLADVECVIAGKGGYGFAVKTRLEQMV
jgi:hypothetical protein